MGRIRREFIQIDQRLFNDPRFYMLSEFEQLFYIKLLSLAKQTNNKIPKNLDAISLYLRGGRKSIEIISALNRLKRIFDNFNENKYFYYFENFDLRYKQKNITRGVEEEEYKEEEKEEEKEQRKASPELRSALDKVFKNGFNIYALINQIKKELGWPREQMFPEPVLLKICSSYEQHHESIKDQYPWFKVALKNASSEYFAEQNIKRGQEVKNHQGPESLKNLMEKFIK